MRDLAAAVALAVASLLALAPGAARAAPPEGEYKDLFKDEIQVKGARAPLAGVEVTSESFEKVEWKTKAGAPSSRPVEEVLSITYADTPTYFKNGMESFKAGRWAEAADLFRVVPESLKGGKTRKFWEARGLAWFAESLRRQAAAEKNPALYLKSAETFADALKKDPKSPILPMVYEGMADALAGGGNGAGALKSLDEYRTLAGGVKRSVWEASSSLLRARILERQGDLPAAANEYAALAALAANRAPSSPPDSADRAALERMKAAGFVGRAWALYARAEKTKSPADLDAAKACFEALSRDTAGSVAGKAAALNGQGALLLAQGKAWEALQKVAEVEVTMYAAPEEVARALWLKAQAYGKLGNNAGRDAALKDLVEYHPSSEWAARAR